MMRLILSNRWLALLWVCGTLASISAFAGKGGKIEQAVDQVQEKARMQNQQLQAQAMSEPHIIMIDEAELEGRNKAELPICEGMDPAPETQIIE